MIIETKLVSKPAFLAVGMREKIVMTPNEKPSENAIAKLWDRFNARSHEVHNQVGYRGYGIMAQTAAMQPGDPIDYSAAVGVTAAAGIPEGMTLIEVPAAQYVVVTYRGPIDGIGEGFGHFWGKWLAEADYVYDGKYEFEFYDQRYRDRDDPESEIDLYFPIVPKQQVLE